MSDSFVTLVPARLLCPGNFPGENTGEGCHFLLQRILPTQRSNLHLLRWQADSLPLSQGGSPYWHTVGLCKCSSDLGARGREDLAAPAVPETVALHVFLILSKQLTS